MFSVVILVLFIDDKAFYLVDCLKKMGYFTNNTGSTKSQVSNPKLNQSKGVLGVLLAIVQISHISKNYIGQELWDKLYVIHFL